MSMQEAIIAAVKSRDTAKVTDLLAQDPTLAKTKTGDGSLLLTAVFYGAREVVPLIHGLRIDLNVYEAATVGDLERLEALLKADPVLASSFDEGGTTALHLAAFFGQLGAAQTLLDHGAPISIMSRVESPHIPKNTPLHAALAGRAHAVAELLIERGADVTAIDSAGLAPIHHAAFGGSMAMTEKLLKLGVEVNPRDKRGFTPYGQAVARGHQECADLLRQHGGVE
jgi:ankyrin repeat protein